MATTSKREQWEVRISAWERSGLSRQSWCAKHGINVHTLDYWRRRVRDEAAPRRHLTGTGLVPVVVAATAGVPALELRLRDGVQLSIPPGADVMQVAALVRALQTC